MKNIITKGLGVLFMTAAVYARETYQSLLLQAAFAGIGVLFITTNTENE
jgi:hypothetical protein